MATATSGIDSRSDEQLRPSTAIVEAVGASAEQPAADLPPLYEVVDPDALDALFANSQTVGAVSFEYAGHDVTVRADGHVDVSPIR